MDKAHTPSLSIAIFPPLSMGLCSPPKAVYLCNRSDDENDDFLTLLMFYYGVYSFLVLSNS